MSSKKFENQDLAEAQFMNVNLYKSHFEDVNMAESVIHNANLYNVKIYDANINGLTIFGIPIDELIEAELDKRDPVRVLLRIKDKGEIQEVRRVITELDEVRSIFIKLLQSQSPDVLNMHPGPDRWSALEHVRHLVFAEDLYLNRWILRNDQPWITLGFLPPFLYGNPQYADVGTEPTEDLNSVLEAWHAVHNAMIGWIGEASSEDLQINVRDVSFGQQTIGDVLQTLASHDLQHIRMAEAAIEDSTTT